MITRLLFTTAMLLSMSAFAADANKAEALFDGRCASCHSLSRTRTMLEPVKEVDRPAHLARFLRSHPSRLPTDDERLVIELLSRRAK